MGALWFSHIRVTKVKLIDKKIPYVLQFKCPWTLKNQYYFVDFSEPPITVCSGVAQAYLKVGLALIWYKKDENLSYFDQGLHPYWFQRYLNSIILKYDFQLPTIMGMLSNISFSSYLYWYINLNSYKYLKSETHFRYAQVNKAWSKWRKGLRD